MSKQKPKPSKAGVPGTVPENPVPRAIAVASVPGGSRPAELSRAPLFRRVDWITFGVSTRDDVSLDLGLKLGRALLMKRNHRRNVPGHVGREEFADLAADLAHWIGRLQT